MHWDKTERLKKFPPDKKNITKKKLFSLSWALTHHRFTFNTRFLFKLKRKVCLFKIVGGIFHFQFCFVFIKDYIFSSTKSMDFLTLQRHNPFKIKVIEKPHIVLLRTLWFLSCNKTFWNSMMPIWVGAP